MQPGDAPSVTQPLEQQQGYRIPSNSGRFAAAQPAPSVFRGDVHPGGTASDPWAAHAAASPQRLAAASQAYGLLPGEQQQRQQLHDLIQQELETQPWQPQVLGSADSLMQQQPSPQLGLLASASSQAATVASAHGGDAHQQQQRDDTPLRLVVTTTPLFGLSQQSPTGLLLSPPTPSVVGTPGGGRGGDQNPLPPLGGAKLPGSSTAGRQAGDAKRRCSTARPRVPLEAKTPAIDTTVAWLTVACGNLRGKLTLADMLVEVQDGEALLKVACSKFEALAGKATTRKWRRSLVVLPEGPFCHVREPVTLGDWLKRFHLDHPMLSPKDWPSLAATAAASGGGGGGQSSHSRGSDLAAPNPQASDSGYPSAWLGGSGGGSGQRGGATLSGASGRATDSSTTSPGGGPSLGVMLTQHSSSRSVLLAGDPTTAVSTAVPQMSPAGGGAAAAGHGWRLQQPLLGGLGGGFTGQGAVPGGALNTAPSLGTALSDPFAALGVSAPWADRSPAGAAPPGQLQQQLRPLPTFFGNQQQQQLSQQSMGTPQLTHQFHQAPQASPARPPPPQVRRTVTVQVPSGDATASDSGPLSQPHSAPAPRRSSSLVGRPRSAGADVGRQRVGGGGGGGGGGSSGSGSGTGPRDGAYVNVACDQLRGRLDLNKMAITVQTGEFAGHLLSPSRFEQLGGRGNTRKWRRSLTVVPDHPSQDTGITLGEWIKQWQAEQAAAAARVSEPESGEGLEWGEGEEGQPRPRRRRPPAIMQPDVAWEPDAARKQRRTRKLRTPSSAPAAGSASAGLLPSPALPQGPMGQVGAGFSPSAAASTAAVAAALESEQTWRLQEQLEVQQQEQHEALHPLLSAEQQQQQQQQLLLQPQAHWQLQAASMFPAVAADPVSYAIPPPPFSSWGLAAPPPAPEQQQQQLQQQQGSLAMPPASWGPPGSQQSWLTFQHQQAQQQQQQQQQQPHAALQGPQQPTAWLPGPSSHSYHHQGPTAQQEAPPQQPQAWQALPAGSSFTLAGWQAAAAGAGAVQGHPGGMVPEGQPGAEKQGLAVPMEDMTYELMSDVYAGGLGGDHTLSMSEGDLSEVLRELGAAGTPRAGGAATPSTRCFNPFQQGSLAGAGGASTEGRSSAGREAGAQGGVFDFSGSRGPTGPRPPSVTLPPWSPTLPSSGSGSDKNSRSTPGSGGSVVDPLLHGVMGQGSFDAGALLRLEGDDLLPQPPGALVDLRGLRAASLGPFFGAGLPPMPPAGGGTAGLSAPPHHPQEQPADSSRGGAVAAPAHGSSSRAGTQAAPPPGPAAPP